jgi:hypothetical protein
MYLVPVNQLMADINNIEYHFELHLRDIVPQHDINHSYITSSFKTFNTLSIS